jgi:hypothetical protein
MTATVAPPAQVRRRPPRLGGRTNGWRCGADWGWSALEHSRAPARPCRHHDRSRDRTRESSSDAPFTDFLDRRISVDQLAEPGTWLTPCDEAPFSVDDRRDVVLGCLIRTLFDPASLKERA